MGPVSYPPHTAMQTRATDTKILILLAYCLCRFMWVVPVRLNDKAISLVTGLVLLLGVGTLVHKGDALFGSKPKETQVASAQTDPVIITDVRHELGQTPAPINTTTISDFEFVRAKQTASVTGSQTSYNTFKIDPAEMDCGLNLSAESLRGARVQLAIIAPCHKNKTITISHAGLRFNEIIDETGRITIIIPVLSDPATIKVSFADGTSKSISAPAKDLSSLQRTGITWSGQTNLQLRVDESSHRVSKNTRITAQNPRSYKQSYLQGGGYLTALGNRTIENGAFTQIYSIENPSDIFVDFNVVVQSTSSNCGARITINTMRYTAASGAEHASKNVFLKKCSAENANIVLKNMLRNLIVAQRN